ncbi:MAG: hypothetical protein Q7R54_00250 [bacterium]|nr:hypothetical protein [bacterium]
MRPKSYLPMRSIILRTIATAGVISLALLAPNALQLVKQFDRAAAKRKNLYANIRHTLWRLEHAGLIERTGTEHLRTVTLTAKGRATIDSVYANSYRIPEPAFWDGKWRILVFDIKEKRKRVRDMLRTLLSNAGFVRMQDSVWIYPYACDEFVELVRAHLKSGTGELQYFVAEAIEADGALRAHFKLA